LQGLLVRGLGKTQPPAEGGKAAAIHGGSQRPPRAKGSSSSEHSDFSFVT
jgi:hypothetical protein